MAESGYSGTPLPRKLGLKDRQSVLMIGLPVGLYWLKTACDFRAVHDAWPEHVSRNYDVIHWFVTDRNLLEDDALKLFSSINVDGSVWISWPKKASKIPTSITEDVLRAVLLPTGLVDVKVCAVDDIWSGLKFVIRKGLRGSL